MDPAAASQDMLLVARAAAAEKGHSTCDVSTDNFLVDHKWYGPDKTASVRRLISNHQLCWGPGTPCVTGIPTGG